MLNTGPTAPAQGLKTEELSTGEPMLSTGVDRIALLDGVRAVAIVLVLIGHCLLGFGAACGTIVGESGVTIFFVLSGFLVTRVMLLDENRTGRLRLGRFYTRRALRIFPAFYTFLFASMALAAAGIIQPADHTTWVVSALYYRNFKGSGWNTAHLWTLALEEQFYLFWPAIFLILRDRRRRLIFIAVAIVTSTFFRFAWLSALPHPLPPLPVVTGIIHVRPIFRMDTFLIGAYFAIAQPEWTRSLRPMLVIPFLAVWFDVAPFHRYTLAFDTAVTAVMIGALILWLMQNPQLRPASYLSGPIPVYLGAISYSIYLWQQLFLGPHLRWWSLGAVAVCALGSYHLVEQPFLRLKDRLGGVQSQATRRAIIQFG